MSKTYELAFEMSADLDSKFSRVFTDASDRIGKLERKLKDVDRIGNNGFGKGIISSLTRMGKAATLAVGVGAAGGILAAGYMVKSSIEKAMDFESEMSTIQALTGATNTELSKMQTLALKMGAATKYSALEAAQGIEELLKAGMQPATVQAGGLEAALNLATAGSLDLATAAQVMSVSLNAFKKDSLSAADAANILAGTANASATSVEDLQLGIAAVGAVASGLELTFRDTSTALGLFTNNGMSASDAGTSFKTMLQNLQPTTKGEIALFKKLGLMTANGSNAFFDAAGNVKSLDQISGLLQKSLKKLTSQQRSHTLELLFGTDAIRAANILYEEGTAGVKDFQKEMSKVTALDVAKKKMDNAAGAVEQFKGAIETLQISALLPTMPIIKNLATSAADFVTKYTPQITEAMQDMVDEAKAYYSEHFTNNPEFQKVHNVTGVIDFVVDDLYESFTLWYDKTGKGALENAVSDMVKGIAAFVDAHGDEIADIGISIGKSIASGIWDGIKKDAFNVYWEKPDWMEDWHYLFYDKPKEKDDYKPKTEITYGSLLPSSGKSTNGESTKNNPANFSSDMRANQAAADANSNESKLNAFQITKRAKGGYITSPELAWIGEGRYPEWVIPQNNSDRSRGLWESAGRSIGALPQGGNSTGDNNPVVIHYSPTINVPPNADADAVKQAVEVGHADFERRIESYYAQKRRRSLG